MTLRWVNAYNGRSANPVLHASYDPPLPVDEPAPGRPPRTSAAYRTACGVQVRNVTRVPWTDRGVLRRCSTCVRAVRFLRPRSD